MPDTERRDTTKKLVAFLQEESNVGVELHQEALRLADEELFDQALDSCKTSLALAQQAHDPYAKGAAWFHMGLLYFLLRENEWDRAAEFCRDAALTFETTHKARAQAVASFAVAEILEHACYHGQDRWQRAMEASAAARALMLPLADLAPIAQDHFSIFSQRYAEHLASSAPATSAASGAAADANPKADNAAPTGDSPAKRMRVHKSIRPAASAIPPRFRTAYYTSLVVSITWLGALAGCGIVFALRDQFAFGLFAAMGLTGILTSVVLLTALLYSNNQLSFRGRAEHATVVMDTAGRRIWWHEDEQPHWLIPFVQQLLGWLPMGQQDCNDFVRNLSSESARSLGAHLFLTYRVINAALIWDRIESELEFKTSMRIPQPIEPDKTGDALDKYAKRVTEERLRELIHNTLGQGQCVNDKNLGQMLLQVTRRDIEATGLFFKKIEIETYEKRI
ncbi:MAG: hypothetical protein HY741_14140 [Chloroflexi bacterium]|nr:hypothetical protein [Chloroflexota bacterium]